MKTITIIITILFSLATLMFISMFAIEKKVSNLPDTNKFKKWWRNNIIGEINKY